MVRASDENHYVVKSINNLQNRRVLTNEFVAGKLAQLVDLPVPNSALIQVPKTIAQEGLYFGSRTPVDPTKQAIFDSLPQGMRSDVANLDVALGCWLFDCWTSNADSTQIVVHRARKKARRPGHYWITKIDHGHCFDGDKWMLRDYRRTFAYWQVDAARHVQNSDDFEPYLTRIRSLIREEIREVCQAVPGEWQQPGESEQLLGVADKLFERAQRLTALWPDWWPTPRIEGSPHLPITGATVRLRRFSD
jgi:hypothetical protein